MIPSTFVTAMGQHVSSVCVITTLHENLRFGLTATAVSSVSAEPPRLLACVNKNGVSHEKILASGVFCVNVLTEDQDAVAKAFAGMLGKQMDRFSTGTWHTLQTGSPVLSHASASFDCKLAQVIDQNSHSILIGDVVVAVSQQGTDALLYGSRRFRTLRKILSTPSGETEETLHF